MRISTKGKYGLAAMVYLAKRKNSPEPTTVASISEELKISKIYLEQIFSLLKKNNLVSSVKGAQGGYSLNLDPEQINIFMILSKIETGLFEKTEAYLSEQYSHLDSAFDELVWTELDLSVKRTLENITLKDLLEKSDSLAAAKAPMFYI